MYSLGLADLFDDEEEIKLRKRNERNRILSLSRRATPHDVVCAICGLKFKTVHRTQKTCGSEKCQCEWKRIISKNRQREERKRKAHD